MKSLTYHIFKRIILILLLLSVCTYGSFSLSDQLTECSYSLYNCPGIPPINGNMPLDCLVGYISMDSIAKQYTYEDISNILLPTLSLDSLRTLLRYMYSIDDYDPVLINSYIVCMNDSLLGGKFKSYPADTYYGCRSELEKRHYEIGEQYSLLLYSNYILQIHITNVVPGTDSTFNELHYWTNVECSVNEKIKGQILPNNCFIPVSTHNGSNNDAQLSSPSCLRFGYRTVKSCGTGFFGENQIGEGNYIQNLVVNEDYLVFLNTYAQYKNVDFLTPVYALEKNGGVFKILNNRVIDENNFWGLGTNPTLNEVKSKIYELISNIKSWWIL